MVVFKVEFDKTFGYYHRALKDGASQPAYRERYKLLFGGLVSVMGKSLREEVEREELLVKRCHNLAELIKDARGENRVSWFHRHRGNLNIYAGLLFLMLRLNQYVTFISVFLLELVRYLCTAM